MSSLRPALDLVRQKSKRTNPKESGLRIQVVPCCMHSGLKASTFNTIFNASLKTALKCIAGRILFRMPRGLIASILCSWCCSVGNSAGLALLWEGCVCQSKLSGQTVDPGELCHEVLSKPE
eukprot:2297953-Amphidinium_carterae.1